jgi:hypothetical protein
MERSKPMSENGALAIVVLIILAVIVIAVFAGAAAITSNLAQRSSAEALVAHEQALAQVETAQAHEEAATERAQTFALTLASLVAMAQNSNTLIGLAIIGLDILGGIYLWLNLRRDS